MGRYAYLSIDNRVVWEEKHQPVPGADVLFVARDRYHVEIPPDERDDDESDTEAGYKTSLRAAKFRLALAGYGRTALRQQWERWRSITNSDPDFFVPNEVDCAFYEGLTLGGYLALLCQVLSSDSPNVPAAEYVLFCPSNHWYAFPSEDPLFAVSAVLHALDGCTVELDLTEFQDVEEAWTNGSSDGHLIVVTEGKSDKELLEPAFRAIEPDMCETIRFFDFDFRPQSGANNNVNLLKSLAAAGVGSPIVALFDNDTAGHQAVKQARFAKLPENFWVGTYPDLQLGESYPTIGPSGRESLNVNGSACSLELYLGIDCLQGSEGLIPVQWTGYNQEMGRYQGALVDKGTPQKKFREKLRRLAGDRCAFSDVERILTTLEAAVHSLVIKRR